MFFHWIINAKGQLLGKLCDKLKDRICLAPSPLDGLGLDAPDPDFEIYPHGGMTTDLPRIGGTRFVSCISSAPSCPKLAMREEEERLAALGFAARIGVELEFKLKRVEAKPGILEPSAHGYLADPVFEHAGFFEQLARGLDALQISNYSIHAEGANDQFEIALPARNPTRAADDVCLTKLLTRTLAASHALDISYSPKSRLDDFGNGCHINFSIEDIKTGDYAAIESKNFASGVARRATDLQLAYCPSEESLLRLFDRSLNRNWLRFSRSIGQDDRDALIRYVSSDSRFEFRLPDSSGSIYSAILAVLASGRLGIFSPADRSEWGDAVCLSSTRPLALERLKSWIATSAPANERSVGCIMRSVEAFASGEDSRSMFSNGG